MSFRRIYIIHTFMKAFGRRIFITFISVGFIIAFESYRKIIFVNLRRINLSAPLQTVGRSMTSPSEWFPPPRTGMRFANLIAGPTRLPHRFFVNDFAQYLAATADRAAKTFDRASLRLWNSVINKGERTE